MRKRYRNILILILAMALFPVAGSLAQPGMLDSPPPDDEGIREELREDIENLRIWKLTKYLDLTPEQSSKFFPIYNEFEEERKKLRSEKLTIIRKINRAVEMEDYPEKELERLLDEHDKITQKELALLAEYRERAQKVLTLRQTAKLVIFSHKFQREIQRMIRDARQKHMQDRPFMQRRNR